MQTLDVMLLTATDGLTDENGEVIDYNKEGLTEILKKTTPGMDR